MERYVLLLDYCLFRTFLEMLMDIEKQMDFMVHTDLYATLVLPIHFSFS